MNTDAFPLPDPADAILRPFWTAAAQHRLEMPRCNDCSACNWYPAASCRHCGGSDFTWTSLAPTGTLFSWAVVRRPLYAPYAAIAPYIPALVELRDAPAVRLVTRLIDADPAALRMDMPVEIVFADLTYPFAADTPSSATGVIAPLARIPR